MPPPTLADARVVPCEARRCGRPCSTLSAPRRSALGKLHGASNAERTQGIASFRQEHLAALGGLFAQVLVLCQKAGLVKLGHIAIDGTKLGANASKHEAMSCRPCSRTRCSEIVASSSAVVH